MRRILFASTSILLLASLQTYAEASISFNRDVLPILANHCFACHGPDADQREADLRLDLEVVAKADRDGSFAIKPGDITQSMLIERINEADPDLKMSPSHFQKPLTEKQSLKFLQKNFLMKKQEV